ncbi:formate hydrogenlyase regulator HycA [Affinibrenneria salicis]|uniref:Formate hydrogenlyase regulator HycA n=1 Tax=Affinibrenneria salicis TaxID=2590031 RepID=A0A5J5FU99_9GAMM|nr:formate hydrogenlyase regulator HycA [Affinibrenneria salicis]KAA8997034.1 formate hydrogenlyase regulator HycA [Affinibrenneria salicis]
MTISELSEKAELIAERQRRLQSHWHTYGNTLVQAITLSKYKLHHVINCEPQDGLCFWLFNHFVLRVDKDQGFNAHTIDYRLESREGGESLRIASARLDNDGLLDGGIDIRNRDKVLEHYLAKIGPVYDCLWQAMQSDTALTLSAIAPALSRASQA